MRSIDMLCFSQMNPSYYAICTIGGGASTEFVENPQKSYCEKQNLYTFEERAGV